MYYRHYWIEAFTEGHKVMWHANVLAVLPTVKAAKSWIDRYLKCTERVV